MRCFGPLASGMVRLAVPAVLLWLALASAAGAHAALTGAEPADGALLAVPPPVLRLVFSEPVSPLALHLVLPGGATVPLDRHALRDRAVEIEPPAGLADGTHVLTWRVVSSDGHPVAGSVVFSIGAPSAEPPSAPAAADAAVRAGLWATKLALYVGLLAGIGGAFAAAWLLPLSRSGSAFAAAALAAGAAGTALAPGFQGLDALGLPVAGLADPAVWTAGFGTSFGRTVAAMLAALVLAGASLAVPPSRSSRLLSLAGLALGAAALALSGHAGAAAPQWLMRPAVFLHAGAMVLWVGALAPLGLALRAGATDAAAGLARFSRLIPAAVAILVLSGLSLAAVQVEEPAALAGTAYGRLLLAKLALLVPLFALAALNRWRLTAPAVRAEAPARRRLARSIALETAIVLVVLGIVAGWRFTPPPRALAIAARQPAVVHIHTGKAMADVTVAPGRTGPVAVSAFIMDGEFGPLAAREVTFVFSNPPAGIEPFRRKARQGDDGIWRADDVVLPLAGTWTLRLDILITDFDLARIEGEVAIRP